MIFAITFLVLLLVFIVLYVDERKSNLDAEQSLEPRKSNLDAEQSLEPRSLKFIHITKCAGTFVENIGRAHGQDWGRFHKEYGFWHDTFVNKPLALRLRHDWFAIVRNPYTRILSEYYWILDNEVVHTVEEFNTFLIRQIYSRSESGDHFTEQFKYVDGTVHIVKLERLDIELQALFDGFKLGINVAAFQKKNTKEERSKGNTPFGVNHFNAELITLINNVYDRDFALFEYPKM